MARNEYKGTPIAPPCLTRHCKSFDSKQILDCYTRRGRGKNWKRKSPGMCYTYHDQLGRLDDSSLNPGRTATRSDGKSGKTNSSGGTIKHTRPRSM